MRKTAIALAAGAIAVLATGCNIGKDPCRAVPPPPAELVRVVAQHPNIEIDYVVTDKIECDLVGGRWVRER
jgi:hypothetical protein